MPNVEPHVEVARKLRSIESVKIGMLQQMADVYRAFQAGSERELAKSLAGLVGLAYFLGRQAGIPPQQIERQVSTELASALGTDAETAESMEAIVRYFGSAR